jgi:hypothetical protein
LRNPSSLPERGRINRNVSAPIEGEDGQPRNEVAAIARHGGCREVMGFATAQPILQDTDVGHGHCAIAALTAWALTTVLTVATDRPNCQHSLAEPVTGKFGGDARIERLRCGEIGAAAFRVLL